MLTSAVIVGNTNHLRGVLHRALKPFVETGLVLFQARPGGEKVITTSEDQYVRICTLGDRKATSLQILKVKRKKKVRFQ